MREYEEVAIQNGWNDALRLQKFPMAMRGAAADWYDMAVRMQVNQPYLEDSRRTGALWLLRFFFKTGRARKANGAGDGGSGGSSGGRPDGAGDACGGAVVAADAPRAECNVLC